MKEKLLYWLHRHVRRLPFMPPLSYGYWAALACEGKEPLHFHHDGCPYCVWTDSRGKEGVSWHV
jgi:hypothetical protein